MNSGGELSVGEALITVNNNNTCSSTAAIVQESWSPMPERLASEYIERGWFKENRNLNEKLKKKKKKKKKKRKKIIRR